MFSPKKYVQVGISNEVYSLINNTQIRPSTNFIVSRCNALYYIKNSEPIIEKAVTKYYEIFPNSSKYTGYTANITLGQFFNRLTCKTCENVAILGGINDKKIDYNQDSKTNSNIISNNSPIIGKRGTENIGLAVFKDDAIVR